MEDTGRRLFSDEELLELSKSYTERILQQLKAGEKEKAIELCEEMSESRIILHDFFADSCVALWSFIGEHMGEGKVEEMFRYVFDQSATRQFYDLAVAQSPPHLTALLLAKSWRAHSCFGKGEFPAKFRITEDSQKFSFHLEPCGSGARLWQRGWYEEGKGGKRSEKAWPWTYNREGLPYYCIHCSFLNEILPYESEYGSLMWIVDPLGGPFKKCVWHVYKDVNDIPEKYYQRMALHRKPVKKNRYVTKDRLHYSKQDLTDMARPMTDRIIEKIRLGDVTSAIELCGDVKDEFLVLHDLYAMMIVSTLTYISENSGENALEQALRYQFKTCIEDRLMKRLRTVSPVDRLKFMALSILGIDNCNGSGYFKGKFEVRETERDIRFVLSPCGSGGRLLRAGSYEKMGYLQKLIEKTENKLVQMVSRILPLPVFILEKAFPFVVVHFSQRKPYAQGKTKRAWPWSFNQKDIPYYCCQCGMLQEQMGGLGFRISPPRTKRSSCIWRVDKKEIDRGQ